MTTWTVIRFLHVLGIAFFVGGQMVLVAAITPVLRGSDEMRAVAKRFGVGSAIALAVIIVTGAALASHLSLWSDATLHAKLGVLVLVFVLTGLHTQTNETRTISLAIVVASIVLVYLGLKLTYG